MERARGIDAPLRNRDEHAERTREAHAIESLATPAAERGAARDRERHVGAERGRELELLRAAQPHAMQRGEPGERRGGVGAAAAEPGTRRDALDQRERRA